MPQPFERQFAREESIDELLHKEWYTVEEVCELFRFAPLTVRHAARQGELHATIIDHQIYGIRRGDLIDWLKARAAE